MESLDGRGDACHCAGAMLIFCGIVPHPSAAALWALVWAVAPRPVVQNQCALAKPALTAVSFKFFRIKKLFWNVIMLFGLIATRTATKGNAHDEPIRVQRGGRQEREGPLGVTDHTTEAEDALCIRNVHHVIYYLILT